MNLQVYATYSDVYAKKITFDDFIKTLKLFHRTFLLGILISVDSMLGKRGYLDQNTQIFLLRSFFPQSVHQYVGSRLQDIGGQSGPALVFTRQQIENLIKLTIFHCDDGGQQDLELASEHIGHLFLMMNDFYDSLVNGEGDKEDTLEYLIRNYLYNSTEILRRKVCRFYTLFIEIPQISSSHSSQNWDQDFRNITGLGIEESMAFGITFLAYWLQVDFSNLATFHPFLNKETYFQYTVLPAEKIHRAFDLYCSEIDICKKNISKQFEDSKNWQLEFDFQRNRPLFEIPGSGIGAYGQSFLIDKFTDNIYWTLVDNLPNDKKEEFFVAFGEIFEGYIFQILKRIFGKKAQKILYEGGKREAADCIVEIKRHVFIFEIKSGRLVKEVHMTGQVKKMFDQFRQKLILRQLKQISNVVNDFKTGAFTVGKVTYQKTKKIFPICVTLQQIPQLPPIRQEMDKTISTNKILQDRKVQPFQILEAEEVEILEAMFTQYFKRSKFLDLMRHKCGDDRLRALSFKEFLDEATSFNVSGSESDEITNIFSSLADRLSNMIFRGGIES